MSYTPRNPNGQATKANSSPVVIASDQDVLATSAKQDTIIGHVDGIETLIGTTNTTLTTIDGRVDGLETLVTSTNTKLDTLITQTDGVEGLLTTIDADTGSILTSVDGIEATLTTISGNVDGLETSNSAIQTAVQLLDDTVVADDAAVTLGTSKANLMAGVAVAMDGTDPTAVSAEGDAAALRTDPNRILLANITHPRFFHVSADYASAQTNASVKAAPGASLSLYITDISISNGATAGNITLLDGSGGTVLYEIYPAINGGATLSLRNPIKLTANTALCCTSTTVTTHAVFVSGYIAA